ncbi:MAG: nitroreductase family protein [Anaerolineae bacterium]|nr:nitroreductase family protein [Anaerolineae bacterium]
MELLETSMPKGTPQELAHKGESMLDMMRKRRTIRQFTDEDVSPEQVETLLEMAMCAPNRLDRRPWHFVVIRDKELQKQLAGILRVHPYLEKAPVLIAVCGLPDVSRTWLMDISAATENMVLAATALGLGATWLGCPGDVLWDRCEKMLLNALGIPRDNRGVIQRVLGRWNRWFWGEATKLSFQTIRIPALVAVGHPAQEPPPHSKHDRFDATRVHYGRW